MRERRGRHATDHRPRLRRGVLLGPPHPQTTRRHQSHVFPLHHDLHQRPFQAIVFITVGTLGDYGNYRKRGLVASSTCGAVVTCLYLIVPASNSLYWLGGLLIIIANISLGVSVVFYNSYLPLMVDDSERVRDAHASAESESLAADEVRAAQEAINSEYSSKGQVYGYVGGTTCLIFTVIAVAVLVALGVTSYWALGIGASISGFWWLGFSFYAFKDLTDRPGPPVPPGTNLYTEGWIRTYRLLAHLIKTTPNTAWFLVLFFFFSDGYATIATVSVLFASRELCMGTVELSLLAVLVPLFAAIGGIAWFKFQQHTGWSSKSVLVLNLCLLAVLPLWGCVGFLNETVGLRDPAELYVLAVWFGACLGSAQAYGRALFSELIPEGHEADMFALFEITDKGSSWLGPPRRRAHRAGDGEGEAGAAVPPLRHGLPGRRAALPRPGGEHQVRARTQGDTHERETISSPRNRASRSRRWWSERAGREIRRRGV